MDSVDFLTQEVIRLMGDVKGKRVLELGMAKDSLSVGLVARGAVPVLIEESQEKLTEVKKIQEQRDLRFELRQSELADLAFFPAESIDIALSIIALSGTKDLARVFRQLQRVLKDQGSFIFGLVHPLMILNMPSNLDSNTRSYKSSAEIESKELASNFPIPLPDRIRSISFSEAFSLLKRAGLSIDQILEIPDAELSGEPCDPTILLIKARK